MREGDAHQCLAERAAAHIANLDPEPRDTLANLVHFIDEQMRLRPWDQPTLVAQEKLAADLLFQRCELAADRRLDRPSWAAAAMVDPVSMIVLKISSCLKFMERSY